MKKYRIAFCGAGGRTRAYARHYVKCDEIEIVAMSDPKAAHRRISAKNCEIPEGFSEYDDWRDMMDNEKDLDGVVIVTPNHMHADAAVVCYERGLPISTEKPLATSKADCERIVDAEKAHNGRSAIGFVLRQAPFYAQAFKLLRDGAIGQITSLQADELPGMGVTSIMNRSPWRRKTALGGGALLEKCCHDMDIMTWLIGSRPMTLNSFGGRLMFNPNPSLPERCDGCPIATDCKFYKRPVKSAHEDQAEEDFHDFLDRESDACIYNIEKDITDTQSVTIEYENGVMANFMMNFNCAGPKAGRNLHVVGHKGRIWGNMHENELFWHDNKTGETKTYNTAGDGSGHGGGDFKTAMFLLDMMKDPNYRTDQNAEAGYRSAVMCFASDISRLEGRRVELVYREDGKIDIR